MKPPKDRQTLIDKIEGYNNTDPNGLQKLILYAHIYLQKDLSGSINDLEKVIKDSTHNISTSTGAISQVISNFVKSSSRLSNRMLWLNCILTIATVFIAIGTAIMAMTASK